MVRSLVIWGLLAGLVAGLLAAGFGKLAGEPSLNEAIAFEDARAGASAAHDHPLVSRGVQSGIGLLGATLILGVSMGGLFALTFAVLYGRVGKAPPSKTALWLALAAFVVIFCVPFV
ncbi:MAG: CbtA family protein, partial [Dehalococcoidia bacterium]